MLPHPIEVIMFFMSLKDGFNKFKNWLNSADRWHDLGHFFFGYFLTSFIGATTGIWYLGAALTVTYFLIKEFIVDGYHGWDNIHDMLHYTAGIGLAILSLLI